MSEGKSIIAINGKPLEKLIDVVSKGLGVLYEPTKIKKEANAEAYKLKVLAKAKKESDHELINLDQQFLERMDNRLLVNEISRQINLENIAGKALEITMLQNTVSDEKVDEDWTKRFFKYAEDISKEEMQNLWASVLAGEVKKPGTFSLRTLETLKNITKQEADYILNLFKNILRMHEEIYFLFKGDDPNELKKYDLPFSVLALLTEIGILDSYSNTQFFFRGTSENIKPVFSSKNLVMFCDDEFTDGQVEFNVYTLTQSGRELYSISDVETNFEIMKDLARYFKKYNLNYKHSNITMISDKEIMFDAKNISDFGI